MTGRHTLPSLRQLQPSLVRDGRTLLMLQPQLPRKTVEISLLCVSCLSLPVSKLTVKGAPFSIHVTTPDGHPEIFAAVCCFTAAIVHSIAAAEHTNAATSGHVRFAAFPFRRILHRVSNFWPELSYALARPLGFISYFPVSCSNLLCCLPQAIEPQRQLRML